MNPGDVGMTVVNEVHRHCWDYITAKHWQAGSVSLLEDGSMKNHDAILDKIPDHVRQKFKL